MKNPAFTASRFESRIIAQIAERARTLYGMDRATVHMDVEATHCNGCPLDLNQLLAFDAGNFGHDVQGIARHLDRQTGKLMDCFLPRCSLPS